MKRILFTALLALIVVAGALPYWFGVEAETIFNEQLTQLESRGDIEVTESTFRRGWLRSHSKTTVLVKELDLLVYAEHTIEHGPFPVGSSIGHLVSLRPLQALIRSRLRTSVPGGGAPDLQMGTLLTSVHIDGSTRTLVDIPAVEVPLRGRGKIVWQPVSGEVDFSPTEAVWQGELHFEGAEWSQSDATFDIGPSVFNFRSYPGSTGLAMGNSTLVSDALNMQLPEAQGAISARGVVVDSTADQQGRNVNYSMSGRFDNANIVDIDLRKGSWSLTASDLDVDTLTRLSTVDVGSALPINELIQLVTKRKASLRSALDAVTDSGPLTANASLSLAGDDTPTNPFLLLGAIQGAVEMGMPAAIVDMAARSSLARESGGAPELVPDFAVTARIQSWVDRNLLTRSESHYRFQASIKGGSVRVNDKPFDLMSLLVR